MKLNHSFSVVSIALKCLFVIVLFSTTTLYGQDTQLDSVIAKHQTEMEVKNDVFSGDGWSFLQDKIQNSNNVLIGEDHLSNEIPYFVAELTKLLKFDNFFMEVDPFSTEIIERSITELSNEERLAFNKKYQDLFSFYALRPEYELLKSLVDSDVNLLGTDQILMYADRLIFQKLYEEAETEVIKDLYKNMMRKSEEHLNAFYKNPEKPMFLMTPEFVEKIRELQQQRLTEYEATVLEAMLQSVSIYKGGKQGHKTRIKLMKQYLMQNYDQWKDKNNLFKYGAVHMPKGESLLTLFDLGNLVSNISEANDQKALHIMVIGQSGMLGSPFREFPPQKVDVSRWPFKNLSPFLTAENSQWKVFDLLSIKKAMKSLKIEIDDKTLRRVVEGYDILVVIPELTAAKF